MSENVLSFKADASDNKARYTCEAKNVMISNILKAEIDLTVLCKYNSTQIHKNEYEIRNNYIKLSDPANFVPIFFFFLYKPYLDNNVPAVTYYR